MVTNYSQWVYQEDDQWYWLDETGDKAGPYTTYNEALVRFKAYGIYLSDGEEAAESYITYMGY